MTKLNIRIFAKEEKYEEYEITDLYRFEEEGIHAFDGEMHYGNCTLRIELGGEPGPLGQVEVMDKRQEGG